MTTITTEELTQFRTAWQDYGTEAVEALDIIEECRGHLEEALEIIMIKNGKEPVRGDDDWIDWENIIKELRGLICQSEFKDAFVDGSFNVALGYLLAQTVHPVLFLIPVILYIFKKGIKHFCR
jgi:hypothetical protein